MHRFVILAIFHRDVGWLCTNALANQILYAAFIIKGALLSLFQRATLSTLLGAQIVRQN